MTRLKLGGSLLFFSSSYDNVSVDLFMRENI